MRTAVFPPLGVSTGGGRYPGAMSRGGTKIQCTYPLSFPLLPYAQTNACENNAFPQLRLRLAKIPRGQIWPMGLRNTMGYWKYQLPLPLWLGLDLTHFADALPLDPQVPMEVSTRAAMTSTFSSPHVNPRHGLGILCYLDSSWINLAHWVFHDKHSCQIFMYYIYWSMQVLVKVSHF